MNVIVGEEWDKALQYCADYFDANAADDSGSIVKVLNEIADRIYPPTPGLVHIVQDERETETVAATNPEDTPGETEAGDKPEESVTEQGAAEPPKGNGGVKQSCPGGNCQRQQYWFWW